MKEQDLISHKAAMTREGYCLDDPSFDRLKQWNGVLFQFTSAKYYLERLVAHEPNFGDLEDSYEVMALLSAFVLQYSKCFASAAKGQVTLDVRKVFPLSGEAVLAHRQIISIRNNLSAHNGNSDLALSNLAVRELEDRFLVKHFITFSIPLNELNNFGLALEVATEYAIIAMNKNLDSISEKLGKVVLLGE